MADSTEDLRLLFKRFAEGLGFIVEGNRIIDIRRLRRKKESTLPPEMRKKTTLKVTRYTLQQI